MYIFTDISLHFITRKSFLYRLTIWGRTICYNEETDEIEYIEETLDNASDSIISIGENILKEHFSDEEIALISENEVAEA